MIGYDYDVYYGFQWDGVPRFSVEVGWRVCYFDFGET
jgi:hypothetical protein